MRKLLAGLLLLATLAIPGQAVCHEKRCNIGNCAGAEYICTPYCGCLVDPTTGLGRCL